MDVVKGKPEATLLGVVVDVVEDEAVAVPVVPAGAATAAAEDEEAAEEGESRH